MPAIIIYLLKVNAALCLFYLAYRFALRPLTFYYLNRFFLVFGLLFSATYPLIDFSSLFVRQAAIRQQLVVIVPDWHAVLPTVQHQVTESINYWGVPVVLFWVGVILMSTRLVVQFISLRRIYKDSEPATHFGQSFRAVKSDVNPFSFWQEIYLNPDKHSPAELNAIIRHEQVHVRQWHTLDVILAELSTIFYWFNPGVWFMRQAVKENLEFITDREMLRSGVDEKAYQYSLVRVSVLKPGAAIVNNFNFLTIKKRIIMMNKKRSSKAQITKYVILLPLVMLLAMIFTASKAELSSNKIAVLMKNILPVSTTVQATPVQEPSQLTAKHDTAQLTLKKDTTRLMVFSGDTLKSDTTIVITNGKQAHTLRNVRVVRINGKNITADDKNSVIILNDKGQRQHISLTEVSPEQIDTIRVSDSARSYTSSKAYVGPVVVTLAKPVTHYQVGQSASTFSIAPSPVTGVGVVSSAKQPRIYFRSTSSYNADDDLVYVIDPKNLSKTDIDNIRQAFKQNGFDLNIRENYKSGTLKGLDVKISSDGKNSSTSASSSYSNNDMSNVDYMIKILADKTTGAVSISAVNR